MAYAGIQMMHQRFEKAISSLILTCKHKKKILCKYDISVVYITLFLVTLKHQSENSDIYLCMFYLFLQLRFKTVQAKIYTTCSTILFFLLPSISTRRMSF